MSLGVSMSVVRRLKAESIGGKKMELGLGIHGEPGARRRETKVEAEDDGFLRAVLCGFQSIFLCT